MAVEIHHLDALPSLEGFDVAVVIDVVRAFTVAPWVLRQGARRLLLARDFDHAVRASQERFPDALLLKDGAPDPRFALSNAPGAIARTDLTGRTVIQATGNGTRGAHAVAAVPAVLVASFANASATAAAIARRSGRTILVPTETDEDVALADWLALAAAGDRPDFAPYLARVRESAAGLECAARGHDPAFPGVDPDDLARCLEADAFGHAMRLERDVDLFEVVPL